MILCEDKQARMETWLTRIDFNAGAVPSFFFGWRIRRQMQFFRMHHQIHLQHQPSFSYNNYANSLPSKTDLFRSLKCMIIILIHALAWLSLSKSHVNVLERFIIEKRRWKHWKQQTFQKMYVIYLMRNRPSRFSRCITLAFCCLRSSVYEYCICSRMIASEQNSDKVWKDDSSVDVFYFECIEIADYLTFLFSSRTVSWRRISETKANSLLRSNYELSKHKNRTYEPMLSDWPIIYFLI